MIDFLEPLFPTRFEKEPSSLRNFRFKKDGELYSAYINCEKVEKPEDIKVEVRTEGKNHFLDVSYEHNDEAKHSQKSWSYSELLPSDCDDETFEAEYKDNKLVFTVKEKK